MSFQEITTSQNTAPYSTCAVTTAMLDFEVLKAFDKIKSDDGSDVVIELIDLYLHSTSQRITAMLNAAHKGEWAVLKRGAHALKGSSSTLGVRQIARICEDLERASSRSDVYSLMSVLESRFGEVKPILIQERNHRRRLPQ